MENITCIELINDLRRELNLSIIGDDKDNAIININHMVINIAHTVFITTIILLIMISGVVIINSCINFSLKQKNWEYQAMTHDVSIKTLMKNTGVNIYDINESENENENDE